MATEKARQVMEDIAAAIGNAEAQLPAARELIKLMADANEDTTEVRALLVEIEARIKQWTRVIERAGITVAPAPPPETE